MSKLTAIILAVFSVVLISVGIVRQADYSEKYVLTNAVLADRKVVGAGQHSTRIYTYNYVVDGEKYTAIKKNGFPSDERIIGYKKTNPSENKIGRIEPVAKTAIFMGIAFALFAVWVLCEFILYESYSDNIFRFILLYIAVGMSYAFEEYLFFSLMVVLSMFFLVCLLADGISICFDFLEFFKRIVLFKKTEIPKE